MFLVKIINKHNGEDVFSNYCVDMGDATNRAYEEFSGWSFEGVDLHKNVMYFNLYIYYDESLAYGQPGEYIKDDYLNSFDLIQSGPGLEKFKYMRFLK